MRPTRKVDNFLGFAVDDRGDKVNLNNASMINMMLEDFKTTN